MLNISDSNKLQAKLVLLQQEQQKIDQDLSAMRSNSVIGAINFGFYQLKKQKDELKKQIIQIHSVLHPDIIA